MATTTVLPQGTYQPQTRLLGPVTVPQGATELTFTFDRTNWTDPAVTLAITIDLSLDGGATWNNPPEQAAPLPFGFTSEGGGGLDKHGNPRTETTGTTSIPQPTNTQRRLRATVTIAGGPLTTNGSVTIS